MYLCVSMGHISAMTDGAPSMGAHSWLSQLQVCKLLQYKDLVVCPEGLNGQKEALQFTLKELPLWDAAPPSKPAHELQLMVVNLGGMQPEGITATIQTPTLHQFYPPPSDTAEPSSDTTAAINLQLMGTMEQLQQASPIAPASVSWHSMPRKQPPFTALGALPAAKELEDPFRPEGMDPVTSVPVVTFTPTIPIVMQMSSQASIPADAFSFTHITPWILQLTLPKTLQMMSLSFITQSQAHTKGSPTIFPDEPLQPQEKMNMALEWLLANRATFDFWCRDLELNTELMVHLNDAQSTEAIREAEVCHRNAACALQQAHWDNVLALECEAKVTKEQDCQAFAEAFGAAVQACQPKSHGALLYPLQILTNDVPLATILGMLATAQLWAIADRGLVLAPPTPIELGTPVLQVGGKCWCHSSDQGAPTPKGPRQDEEEAANIDEVPEECPHRKHKEGKALKEPRREAFSKESDIMKVARWAY